MAILYLIRHGETNAIGRVLSGRRHGVSLTEEGLAQADRLARLLAVRPLQRIQSSPLERCLQTAEPLAQVTGLPVEQVDALTELDYGSWTGHAISSLEAEASWRWWNVFRSGSRIPKGESMLEVQARVMSHIARMHALNPDAAIACFTHADVIRAALAGALGSPLDLILRIEVGPASVSVLDWRDYGVTVLGMNDLAAQRCSGTPVAEAEGNRSIRDGKPS